MLRNKQQELVLALNVQCSSWANIRAGVQKGPLLGPLLFLIYNKNLSNYLKSKRKLFADDASLFSISTNDLKNDSETLILWAWQWKMNFNPDPNKYAQKVIFSQKKMFLSIRLLTLTITP